MKSILVTGGAGFIGSHVVRLLTTKYKDYKIINFDKLTYAGNLENLVDIASFSNYEFIRGDICNYDQVHKVFTGNDIQVVVHLAAESHVDRSIKNPLEFVETNVLGTVNLLSKATEVFNSGKEILFYHISTDEVFGTAPEGSYFTESTNYDPKSPYSASKASSDHFVRAYHNTYNLPVVISNCSNNYGPYQFPEKLIPLVINNAIQKKEIPVYGEGKNIRDWLYVEDHAKAIDLVMHEGKAGETYNIGGFNEWKNIDTVEMICDIVDEHLGNDTGQSRRLIRFVSDRPGHDLRYAIDSSKIHNQLMWKPSVTFEEGLRKTIQWYLSNQGWLSHVTSGEYLRYYQDQYKTEEGHHKSKFRST